MDFPRKTSPFWVLQIFQVKRMNVDDKKRGSASGSSNSMSDSSVGSNLESSEYLGGVGRWDFVHFLLRKLMKLVQITPSCRFFSVERYCRSYLEEGTQKRNYKEVIKQVGFRIGPCKTQLTSTSAGVCGLGWRWKYSTQQSNPEITDKSLPQFSEI